MGNLIKINGREGHLIGVQQIKLGNNTYYDLYEQKHRPWFVIVLDTQERHTKKDEKEKLINGN